MVKADLFDTKIMGLLTPPPSVVRNTFNEIYKTSSKLATDYYYQFSKRTNYIRTDRIAKLTFQSLKRILEILQRQDRSRNPAILAVFFVWKMKGMQGIFLIQHDRTIELFLFLLKRTEEGQSAFDRFISVL